MRSYYTITIGVGVSKYGIIFSTEPTTPLRNADHGGSYCDSAMEVRSWTLTSLTKIHPDDYWSDK